MSRPSISGYTFLNLKIGIQSPKVSGLQKVHKNNNLKKEDMLSVQKFMDLESRMIVQIMFFFTISFLS